MPILFDKFRLAISSPCLMAIPDGEVPCLSADIGDLNIITKFLTADYWKFKGKDDQCWTKGLAELEVTVSRNESDKPPDVVIALDGMRDITHQSEYLRIRLPEYQTAALEVANRVLRYFRFELLTPGVRWISTWDQSLYTPTWYGETGNALRGGTWIYVAQPVHGLHGELGAKKLSRNELPDLQAFVASPTEPSLVTSLLSDAQTAWFEGSLRRAALELAICTEVLVKRHFFAKATPAGAAFDYLEDKARVSVRVLELIDAVAEVAFGKSYKKNEPSNYLYIDQLFRCRNKIAHRGELSFRDDAGNVVIVDAPMVESWWHAVFHLKQWLESL